MTAPLLNLLAIFHLNLAFSSIEEEQRAQVVRDCYGPLLDLPACVAPTVTARQARGCLRG
jgi:hypothetical protein